MTQKKRSAHDLAAIKLAFSSSASLKRTMVSARDAGALGFDAADVVTVIQSLRYPHDFEKSATAHHDRTRWHDSYVVTAGALRLYLKFTDDGLGGFILTSFKEAG